VVGKVLLRPSGVIAQALQVHSKALADIRLHSRSEAGMSPISPPTISDMSLMSDDCFTFPLYR
jgi:hypothetical protein